MPELQDKVPVDDRPVDRRSFLRGALVVVDGAALGRIPVATAAHPPGVDRFLDLSRIATGVNKLASGLAHEYLRALEEAPQLKLKPKPSKFLELAGYASGHGARNLSELKQSAAFKAEGGEECVGAIVAAWWSGLVPAAGGGQRVVTYSDALVWLEVHEPTTCQGATDSWAKPGRAVA